MTIRTLSCTRCVRKTTGRARVHAVRASASRWSGRRPSSFGQWGLAGLAQPGASVESLCDTAAWPVSKQHHKLFCRDSQWLACCLLARSTGGSGTYFAIQNSIYPSAHLGRIGPDELLCYDKKTCVCSSCVHCLSVRPPTGPDTGFDVCLSVRHVRPSVSLIRVCVCVSV